MGSKDRNPALCVNKQCEIIGSEKDLFPTLELIKTVVLNGELDTQTEAAASKLRDGFAQ